MWSEWTTIKKMMWLRFLKAASFIIKTVTGTSPLVLENAVEAAIKSLKQYGKCEQDGTPTPDAPVDIMCNNGAIKYGWHDIITTSALSGYGTYVSPSQTATTRAYRWFRDLPNGTYQFAVDGDYEIIVQWRDPADPADGVAQFYENLSGWMTSGEVTLDKTSGGYGIAVKRSSGTSSITPANFDGVLHVQELGLYVDGADEVLTVSATGAETQTVTNIPDLFAVGDYADTVDIISGGVVRKCGIHIFDGNETISLITNKFYYQENLRLQGSQRIMCSHFQYKTTIVSGDFVSTASSNSRNIIFSYGAATSVAEFKDFLRTQYAAGIPVIVIYPLAEEIEETVTPHPLTTAVGTNTLSWNYPGSTKTVEYAYQEPTNKVGTAKVGTAKAG